MQVKPTNIRAIIELRNKKIEIEKRADEFVDNIKFLITEAEGRDLTSETKGDSLQIYRQAFYEMKSLVWDYGKS